MCVSRNCTSGTMLMICAQVIEPFAIQTTGIIGSSRLLHARTCVGPAVPIKNYCVIRLRRGERFYCVRKRDFLSSHSGTTALGCDWIASTARISQSKSKMKEIRPMGAIRRESEIKYVMWEDNNIESVWSIIPDFHRTLRKKFLNNSKYWFVRWVDLIDFSQWHITFTDLNQWDIRWSSKSRIVSAENQWIFTLLPIRHTFIDLH